VRKTLGLFGLLVALAGATAAWEQATHGNVVFFSPDNIRNQLTWVGLFGILSLAQAIVIITGGIDLSVGSVTALVGITCAMLLDKGEGWAVVPAITAALLVAAAIGLCNGLLVSKVRLQPFVVTLCGLFIYRGIARLVTGDQSQGFGSAYPNLTWLGGGAIGIIPIPFIILIVLAAIVGAYLHFSPQGRHIFAMGANEEAALLSGIRVDQLKILAYVLCGLITGIGGLLLAFKVRSLGPSNFGAFYELYAIAGAVLGGCSLRGGAGNVLGVVIAASLIVVLRNLVNILEISSQLEYVVIGGAILIGVTIDEVFQRRGRQTPRPAA